MNRRLKPAKAVAVVPTTPSAPPKKQNEHKRKTTAPPPTTVLKRPRVMMRSPNTMPDCLKCMGNFHAWRELLAHLCGPERHIPVILWGPVGCGKSYGISELLKFCGLSPLIIDGVSCDTLDELRRWMRDVIQTNELGNVEKVLFIDDMEGFSHGTTNEEQHTSFDVILQTLKTNVNSKDSPKIITCNDIYARNMQSLRQMSERGCVWKTISEPKGEVINYGRCMKPLEAGQRTFTPAQVTSWGLPKTEFCVHLSSGKYVQPMHTWKRIRCYSPKDEQIQAWFTKKGYSSSIVKKSLINIQGDIRKFIQNLKQAFVDKDNGKTNTTSMIWDDFHNSLSITNRLLSDKSPSSLEQWAGDPTTFDSHRRILYQNLYSIATSSCKDDIAGLEACANVLDTMSYADHSVRIDETFMVLPSHRFHLAHQTRKSLSCDTKDVPPLHLKKDQTSCNNWKTSSTDPNLDSRLCSVHDTPASLGGLKIFEAEPCLGAPTS